MHVRHLQNFVALFALAEVGSLYMTRKASVSAVISPVCAPGEDVWFCSKRIDHRTNQVAAKVQLLPYIFSPAIFWFFSFATLYDWQLFPRAHVFFFFLRDLFGYLINRHG
jgi:hypothetical protein